MWAASCPTVLLGKQLILEDKIKKFTLTHLLPLLETEMVWGTYGDTGYQ